MFSQMPSTMEFVAQTDSLGTDVLFLEEGHDGLEIGAVPF